MTTPIGFIVFPFPSAMCLIAYSIGRILYQIGYTVVGFGAHAPGFAIDRFSTFIMLGFVLIAGVKMV